MLTLKTRVTNLTDHLVSLPWASCSLRPHGQVVLDGAYPTACNRVAMRADIDNAVAQRILHLELLTSIDAVIEHTDRLMLSANPPLLQQREARAAAAKEQEIRKRKQAIADAIQAKGVTLGVSTKRLPPDPPLPQTTQLDEQPLQVFTDEVNGIATIRIKDGKPQMVAANSKRGLLHISKFPTNTAPRRALIVGKGPSMTAWSSVPDIDAYFTLNEATYVVDRQHFHCRGDGNREGHRFCDWLPHYAVPMVHARIKDYYGYGYWFEWMDIGDDSICLTVVQAMRLAYWMGCRDIVMVGCDALFNGTTEYSALVANSRNLKCRYKEQRDRVSLLPREFLQCFSNHEGVALHDALLQWRHSNPV